jgi:3-oxoacyl-[acyl-carrier-protein] synthase III
MRAKIEAIAYALPEQVVTNDQLRRENPDWDFAHLERRTGVLQRHIAGPEETAVDLAMRACGELQGAGLLDSQNIGAIIFCTETPDYHIPPNACLIHGRLEFPTSTMAFDLNLGCSGFVYGLSIAQSLLAVDATKRVLLLNGDTYSRLIHPGDRSTRCLFGDGASATVIAPAVGREGVLDIRLATAGHAHERFMVKAGGARKPRDATSCVPRRDRSGNLRSDETITMDGIGVLSFFNSALPAAVTDLLSSHRLTVDDIDLFVFHQASQVALESLERLLKISKEKMVYDLANTGNLVSASIPVAMKRCQDTGKLKAGSLVVLCGFGVGLSWGTALVRT